jgi:hypothetical protein
VLVLLLVISAVWVFAIVLAVALCAAARMGDAELEAEVAPVIELRRAPTRRFRGSAA